MQDNNITVIQNNSNKDDKVELRDVLGEISILLRPKNEEELAVHNKLVGVFNINGMELNSSKLGDSGVNGNGVVSEVTIGRIAKARLSVILNKLESMNVYNAQEYLYSIRWKILEASKRVDISVKVQKLFNGLLWFLDRDEYCRDLLTARSRRILEAGRMCLDSSLNEFLSIGSETKVPWADIRVDSKGLVVVLHNSGEAIAYHRGAPVGVLETEGSYLISTDISSHIKKQIEGKFREYLLASRPIGMSTDNLVRLKEDTNGEIVEVVSIVEPLALKEV